jgi:hypothetical protein
MGYGPSEMAAKALAITVDVTPPPESCATTDRIDE